MSTGFSKDSKNPYRTGVLVGNHTEDRFGQEISAKPVSHLFSKKLKSYHLIESFSASYHRVTFKLQPRKLHVRIRFQA